jgi:hypothetical protein
MSHAVFSVPRSAEVSSHSVTHRGGYSHSAGTQKPGSALLSGDSANRPQGPAHTTDAIGLPPGETMETASWNLAVRRSGGTPRSSSSSAATRSASDGPAKRCVRSPSHVFPRAGISRPPSLAMAASPAAIAHALAFARAFPRYVGRSSGTICSDKPQSCGAIVSTFRPCRRRRSAACLAGLVVASTKRINRRVPDFFRLA